MREAGHQQGLRSDENKRNALSLFTQMEGRHFVFDKRLIRNSLILVSSNVTGMCYTRLIEETSLTLVT